MTYRVLLEFITRVNGSYNDGGTTLTNSICVRRIVENTQSYEVWNGGSIPSGRTKKQLTTTAKGCIITFLTQRGNDMKRSGKR